MARNLLKKAEVYNSTDNVGLTYKELTRTELMKLVGLSNGSIAVPSLNYICFEAAVKTPFYCKDFTLTTSEGTAIAFAYYQKDPYHTWKQLTVERTDDGFYIDFNKVQPDQAQMIYKLKFAYANLSPTETEIYGCELLTVDYPIEFDYARFSVVATSKENLPITVTNKSIQQTEKDIRVLPVFSGDYLADCVYMVTASGKEDEDKYHIQRGFRFPEDAAWSSGRYSYSENPNYPYVADGATNSGTESIVDAMTSNSTPAPFVAVANNEYGTTFGEAYRVFDGADGQWSSYPVPPPGYLQVYLGGQKVINRYNIKKTYHGENPKSWLIQGGDGMDGPWTTLHTVEDFDWTEIGVQEFPEEYFHFVNNKAFSWYRIYITEMDQITNRCLMCSWVLIEAEAGVDDSEFLQDITSDGRDILLTSTSVSGAWTSPVVYLPDEDMISMYVYGDDIGEDSFISKDFKRIDRLIEVRTSDVSPRPNFLVHSLTSRLFTWEGKQMTISLPARRPGNLSHQDNLDANSSYWYATADVCAPPGVQPTPCPFMVGRSKRMYIKGDGTVIAQSPVSGLDVDTTWEIGHRGYQQGIPFKEFGDINDYWNAGHMVSLQGSFIPYVTGGCGMAHFASSSVWHSMVFASEEDQSDWYKGREAWKKLKYTAPYYFHFSERYSFGACQERVTFEPLGSYTFAMDGHPNEWMNVTGIMYPWSPDEEKYMCLYYTHVRNFWPSESKFLGSYGIGAAPCDEGWAMCKSSDGGFWLHVGYMHRILDKYDSDGERVSTSRCNYGFNAICETSDPDGLWCLRNDAVYWYEQTDEGLVESFSVTNPTFKYLQMGGVDSYNNLWVIDRDTSTIYRIKFSSRSIDYEKEVPYTVGVWPHPRDGSAYLYSSFNADTFSTAIKRIDSNDRYGYTELIAALPELPISDYSGVQFMGKAMQSYLKPAINDPVWGTSDSVSLDWQTYPNASLTLPGGKYKQFRITLGRSGYDNTSPKLTKIRIPKSMVLSQVPYGEGSEVYLNPHLRYNKKFGHFDTELVVWWPH